MAGLLSTPASIAPKYFYDAKGCALFARHLPSAGVLPDANRSGDIRALPRRDRRCRRHGQAARRPRRRRLPQGRALAAVPRAVRATWRSTSRTTRSRARCRGSRVAAPATSTCAACSPISRAASTCRAILGEGATTFFYPGSSIGNFVAGRRDAVPARDSPTLRDAAGSGLLIGVDTQEGSGAARRGLRRRRRRHRCVQPQRARARQSHPRHALRPGGVRARRVLQRGARRASRCTSRRARRKRSSIDGVARTFAAGERIHTENSYKYAPQEFVAMLERAGFADVRCWQDDAGDFAVYYAA